MTIVANNIHGDYQLANGYGHDKAKEVLKVAPNSCLSYVFFFCNSNFLTIKLDNHHLQNLLDNSYYMDYR